jgi:cyclin-dependent kinase-like
MPEIKKPETIERRFLGKLQKKELAFMKSLLKMEPTERLTAEQAINSPYFDDIRKFEDMEYPIINS